ncbi:MAG: hybrid sensor histidine kinase/response regulator, partial [Actinomycetota bacterium]
MDGRWVTEILPQEIAQERIALAQQVLQTGQIQRQEYQFVHQGVTYYEEARIAPLWNEDVLVVVRDITEQKQAEKELQRINKQLQRINECLILTNVELDRATRFKDEFLANMSHELRTPLNAILGLSESLKDQLLGGLNDRQQNAINSIEHSGQHLLDLINDILDLAKIEAGKLELQLAPVEIDYLCTSSLNFVRQQATAKHLQLTTELPSGLPAIRVDELRIRQVLINLLNNAVKFTPDGGQVRLVVRPEQVQEQWFLCFQVFDTGIGITSENIEKLFQPFTQINSQLNRRYMGTGLGLSLVRRLVELHQGTVAVSSEVDRGSCFSVCLPYQVDECLRVGSETAQNSSLSVAATLNETTLLTTEGLVQTQANALILLAEDNAINATTISSYLEARGYRLLLAHNGEEAVTLATTHHPDLILMDIQMPEMDGLEAIAQIRADADLANTPIIAVTALAMSGDREKCLAAGANDYIAKPLKLKQLFNMIQGWLN